MKKIVILGILLILFSFTLVSQEKKIVVLIDRQVIQVYQDGKLLDEFDCVTGKNGSTKKGIFKIEYRGNANYMSKTYNVLMPYPLFFDDGRAIHGTSMATIRSYSKWLGLDGIGTHGCVGVTDSTAEWLFNWAPNGTPIIIK